MSRKQYTGVLCVYRESSLRGTLSADVRFNDGTVVYWDRAPKCFDDAVVDGTKNLVEIEFTANDDKQCSNPRNVKVLRVIKDGT